MKHIKLFIVALALLFGASSARAYSIIGIVTNYSTLDISLVITTNPASVVVGKSTKWTVGAVKFTNTQLLELFSEWAGTGWPTGAQLVQGWDNEWYGDVLVVDKTGTNVLYDATADYYNTQTHYFYLDIFAGYGSYNETQSDVDPGSESFTWFNSGYFALFDDNYYLPYTYLYSYGPNTEVYSENWNDLGNEIGGVTKWSDSETFTINNASESVLNSPMYFVNSAQSYADFTISGSITSKGKGKSGPVYLYDEGEY